jgi:hypothetical protein
MPAIQYFIVHAPLISVSTSEGTISSPGLQFQCGTCPTRVFVQQLTNLLPLLEHARSHEPRGLKVSQYAPGMQELNRISDAGYATTEKHQPLKVNGG